MSDKRKEDRKKIDNSLKKIKVDLKDLADGKLDLPPSLIVTSFLLKRLRSQRIFFITISGILAGIICYQSFENAGLIEQIKNKSFFLVPTNIAEITRVRPNSLDDERIYEFAEWFIDEYGNITYDHSEAKLKTLTKYMHPSMRARFMREFRSKMDLYQARKIDEVFTFEKVESYDRKSEKIAHMNRTVYVVSVWGKVRKYVEGRVTVPYSELITVKFQTSHITGEKSWLFEVVDITRKTKKQLDDERISRASSR